MARNYSLTLVNNTSGAASAPRTTAATSAGDIGGTGSALQNAAKAVQSVKKIAAVGFAKSVVMGEIGHHLSTESLRTGREEMQRKMEYQYSAMNMALAGVGSIVASIATGNPIPALMFAANGTMQLIGVAHAQNVIDIKRKLEDVQIGLANIRAGSFGDRVGRDV